MTTDGATRPSDDGARPTSRFQEGSMNDRTSAAPPVQFLGPEEAAALERQFYGADLKNGPQRTPQRTPKRIGSISRRRERPTSAQGPSQGLPNAMLHVQEEKSKQIQEEPQTEPTQKRAGFLGRVREALFGKPAPYKPAPSNVQNEIGKRTSLQQPPVAQTHTYTQARPIPIPIQGGMAKSQSSSHIPQLPASFHGGGNMNDRPSRDEIMASYNELMATGFFKAHAIQSTRQPAPGTSLPNTRYTVPSLPTIPSPNRPSLAQVPKRPSVHIIPPSRDGEQLPIPPMPSSMPPPPPLLSPNQLRLKPSWESFRNGIRGRKRARADSSDDNNSESASVLSQQLNSSSTSTQIATQVTGIGRRVSKKLRKMPSVLASQLQAKSDGMIRVVPTATEDTETRHRERPVRMRSPSPGVPAMTTGFRGRDKTSPVQRSISGRFRKRGDRGKSPSRPPVALNNYPRLDPSRMAPARSNHQAPESEPMDIDSVHSNRSSLDSIPREHDMEKVGHLLREGQLGVSAEPLSVVPDLNRGIPSVPRIPKHYNMRGRMGSEENYGAEAMAGKVL